MLVAHHQQPQQPHPDHIPQQTCPGVALPCSRKRVATVHVALSAQIQSHESLQSLHGEQLLSMRHGTAPKGGDRDKLDKPYNTSITASMLGGLPC